VDSVRTSQPVEAVPSLRCRHCQALGQPVQVQYAYVCSVCLSCKQLSCPRKRRFCQQTSNAEAVIIFMKGHETLTSARQPIPVPLSSLQLQPGSAGRSDPVAPLHVQNINCLCKAKLKVGSCFLAHSCMRNLEYFGERQVSSQTSAFHCCQVIQTIMEMSILFSVNKNKKFPIIYGIYLNDMQITLWNLGGESRTTETAQLFPRTFISNPHTIFHSCLIISPMLV